MWSARPLIAPPGGGCSDRNGSALSFTIRSIRGHCAKQPSNGTTLRPRPETASRLFREPRRARRGRSPRLGFPGSRVDRAAERRADAEALRALENDSRARAYVVGGELIV